LAAFNHRACCRPWAGFGIGSYDGPAPTDHAAPLRPDLQKQLFIDNHALASATGLRRALHQPRRLGAVITSPIPGFDIQSRSNPQWNPEQRIWEWWLLAQRHNAGDGAGADGGGDGGKAELASVQQQQRSPAPSSSEAFHPDDLRAKDYFGNSAPISNLTLYCTSTDGEVWTFPNLGLFEWQGSTDNPIAVDPTGDTLFHCVRDEDEPDPAQRCE
jgi:hypothetical protein